MKTVRYYHKQFTLNTTETKLLNELLSRFFDLSGMTKIEIYQNEDKETDEIIVEIQGAIEE